MIGIGTLISSAMQPISGIINKLITKKEDRMLAEAEILKIKNELEAKILDNQNSVLTAQKDIILAETKGRAIQRNWRPALMWVIILIIANNYLIAPIVNNILTVFDIKLVLPLLELPDKLFNLMTVGLGGYVVGRSAEKIVPKYVEARAIANNITNVKDIEKEIVTKRLINEGRVNTKDIIS